MRVLTLGDWQLKLGLLVVLGTGCLVGLLLVVALFERLQRRVGLRSFEAAALRAVPAQARVLRCERVDGRYSLLAVELLEGAVYRAGPGVRLKALVGLPETVGPLAAGSTLTMLWDGRTPESLELDYAQWAQPALRRAYYLERGRVRWSKAE
ncbi:MAG: hypothetical protein JNK72_13980 [Myxococcales bacterium]|nr:hypothetical protein [Myxococcales bacterium]